LSGNGYPDENVASLQQLVIPEDRPINFMLTSDAPMNSFWIPALAGQIYTMNGMSTKLHIMADQPGDYLGMSANISGEGFADMKFTATVKAQPDFDAWMQQAKQSPSTLGTAEYETIAEPSVNPEVKTYTVTKHDLYNDVVMKYMHDGMEM
jgi:cytochrome o ubiquinol oxidase subunit II